MRQLERERRGVWFAAYEGKKQLVDDEGRLTGEWAVSYSKPKLLKATVSPNSGNTWGDGFGIGVDCDRTVTVDDIGTGLDEACILWVDKQPTLLDDGSLELDEAGNPSVPNDYAVSMVAESYNYTAIAIKKVG